PPEQQNGRGEREQTCEPCQPADARHLHRNGSYAEPVDPSGKACSEIPDRALLRCDDPFHRHVAAVAPHEETRLSEPAQPVTRVDPLPPPVGRRLLRLLVGAAIVVLLVVLLFDTLREFFQIILLSLFLSFAIEPAVNWLPRQGWKRWRPTGTIFLGRA